MFISIRKLINYISLIIIAAYAFSQMSLANAIPVKNWLLLMIVFTVIPFIYSYCKSPKRFKRITVDELLVILMTLIVLFWNNYNLKKGNYAYEVFFVIIAAWYFLLKRWDGHDNWYTFAFKGMSYMGVFYALMTIVSMAIPSFYDGFVYPIISSYNTMYSTTYLAGFTSHYSSNAMYLAIAICFSFCYVFFTDKNENKFKPLVIFGITAAALLISSKRGPVVCLIFAFLLTYYVYCCNKPLSRWFKILCLIFAFAVIFSIASYYVPELNNVIDRFISQAAKGDITTQRIYIWAEAIPAFLSKPVLGNGWCWFRYHNTFGVEYHVHNVYLQWLTEVGIVGSIPFFTYFILSFVRAIRLLMRSRKGKINIGKKNELYLCLSLCFQAFFIPFCFEGTGFYEVQVLLPYFISCIVTHQIWDKYKHLIKRKELK